MTGILIKRGNLDTEMDMHGWKKRWRRTGRRQSWHWTEAPTRERQRMPRTEGKSQKSEEAKRAPSLEPPERPWPADTLTSDF